MVIFRHNSLTPSNIMVYLRNDMNVDDGIEYIFNKNKYYLKNSKLDIKITNFNDSNLDKNNDKKIPFANLRNKYFDLHYFLNTLLYKNKISNLDDETTDFLNRILKK